MLATLTNAKREGRGGSLRERELRKVKGLYCTRYIVVVAVAADGSRKGKKRIYEK